MRIERILCPTDLTADSKAAWRYAAALAQAYEAQLIQIYCESTSVNAADGLPGKPRDLMAAALAEHAGEHDPRMLGWESIVVSCDDPGDCIAREASRHRTDLIIMRSRRRPHRAQHAHCLAARPLEWIRRLQHAQETADRRLASSTIASNRGAASAPRSRMRPAATRLNDKHERRPS